MQSHLDQIATRAQSMLEAGRAADAASFLGQANRNSQMSPAARRLYARALAQLGDLNAALDQQSQLLPPDIAGADEQGRADALAAAQLAQMAMYYSQAARIVRQLVDTDPGDISSATLLATLLLWIDGPDAARSVMAGIIDRNDAPPHLLAEALAYYSDPPEHLVNRIRAAADDERLPAQSRTDLFLALAQHYDRAAEFDYAWELTEQGNALAPPRQAQDWEAVLKAHVNIYTNTRRRSVPQTEQAVSKHLYLLGTPRSGQSLLQSILAAAPKMASIGERGALLQHILFRTGEISKMAPAERWGLYEQLSEADRRGILRLAGKPDWVIDKSPLHLAVAGSVSLIHPTASFAAVLRDPADTAMSIWMRNFPPIFDYAGSLDTIFDQLDFAFDAVTAWRTAGLDIRLFDHAALVSNPAKVGKQLFDWLGADWNDKYVNPQNRTEPVSTFSAAQVRSAISPDIARSSAPYAKHLNPYRDRILKLRDKKSALMSER